MKSAVFIILGLFFSGLGLLGVFLPILPTTPFALAALYFFSASSEQFKRRLLENRFLGPPIKRIQMKQGLSVKEKVSILVFVWFSVGSAAVFFVSILCVRLLLFGLLLFKTWFIIRFKTYPPED